MSHFTRRDFLRRTGANSLIFSSLLAAENWPALIKAAEAAVNRRHMIVIHSAGGWDGGHLFSAFHSELHLNSVPGYQSQTVISDSHFAIPASQRAGKRFLLNRRGRDEDLLQNRSGNPFQFYGKVWRMIFDRTAEGKAASDAILVWRGLGLEGDHGTNNLVINHGTSSPYAVSICGISAAEMISLSGVRPLNYLAIANSPGEVFSNTNLSKPNQLPVCVPNYSAFGALTHSTTLGADGIKRRQLVESTLQQLATSTVASRFLKKAGKDLFDAFLTSHVGAVSLATSEHADTIEFLALRKKYFIRALETLVDIGADPDLRARIYLSAPSWVTQAESLLAGAISRDFPKSDAEYLAWSNRKSELREQLDSAVAAFNDPSGPAASILEVSFRFAMAEYAVKKNLAGATELRALGGDFHNGNGLDIAVSAVTMTHFRELVLGLKSAPLAGETGNLLSRTLILVESEFEREAFFSGFTPDADNQYPGTAHGRSTTLLLAGTNIAGGKILGNHSHGPSHLVLGYPMDFQFPLPVDLKTGETSPSGSLVSVKSVLRTILSGLGYAIPSSQVTEAPVVGGVFL